MSISKYQTFTIEERTRDEIKNAPYNPRKITDEAFKKLKSKIKSPQFGLLQPLIINRQTGNLVGGHQRLSVLDELHQGKPYSLSMAVVELSEKDEVEANIFMNNQSAMGKWDIDILKELKMEFNFDLEKDLGFEPFDIDFMMPEFGSSLAKTKQQQDVDNFIGEIEEEKKAQVEERKEKTKELRKEINERNKQKDEEGSGWYDMKDDYHVTIVFQTTKEKQEFLSAKGIKKDEKFIKADDFFSKLK